MTDAYGWGDLISDWIGVMIVAGRPQTTISQRRYQLRHVAAGLAVPPGEVTHELLMAWLRTQKWGPETRRSYRSALAKFFGWAHHAGRIAVDPTIGLPSVKATIPNPQPAPMVAYREALLRAGPREALMLRLACDMGMRRGEVAVAHSDDLERDLAGWTLVVHGKGNKVRRVPVPADLVDTLRARHGWFFPGKIDGHLSPWWVGRLVSRLLPGVWTMHKLRHRYATDLFAVERDLATVQDALGHADPKTTRAYVLVPQDALRNSIERMRAARLVLEESGPAFQRPA